MPYHNEVVVLISAVLTETTTDGPGNFSNNKTASYCTGGKNAGSYRNTIQKLTWPGEVRSTLSATLNAVTATNVGFSNSGTAGYITGGYGGSGYISWVTKLAYSGETTSTLTATLSTAQTDNGAYANSGTAGYVFGGYPSNTAYNKFLFSNDTRTTMSVVLTAPRNQVSGMANSGTAGYAVAGIHQTTAVPLATIDKLTFSNDSVAAGNPLMRARAYPGSTSNNGVAGYIQGGSSTAVFSGLAIYNTEKLVFPTDTQFFLPAASLTQQRAANASAQCAGL